MIPEKYLRPARSIRSSPRNVRQEISIPAVRSGQNERLGAPASFRHESARRKGHGKNRRMSEIAEAPLRRTTSYPRQQLTAGYGYWPSLADRPVSCAPRRRCGILFRGQEVAVHVDEAVCRLNRRGSADATQRRGTGTRANVRPIALKESQEISSGEESTVVLEKTDRSPRPRRDGSSVSRAFVHMSASGSEGKERLTAPVSSPSPSSSSSSSSLVDRSGWKPQMCESLATRVAAG